MRKKFRLRKTLVLFTAVTVLVFGMSGVTAWAATIGSHRANVRESAVDGEVLDTLAPGTEVSIVSSTEGDDGFEWYEIRYEEDDEEYGGWIRSDLVNAADDSDADETAEGEDEEQDESENQHSVATNGSDITYVVASSIPSRVVPDGFHLTSVGYEGTDVPAVKMDTANVYLLYMEDASGTASERFVVYDMDRYELIPYIRFDTRDGFVVLTNIPDEELANVADRFTLTTCAFDTGNMDALQMLQKDAIISDSANLAELYYMYGVNQDGTYGWYVYDSQFESLQENALNMSYNLNGNSAEGERTRSGFSLDSLSLIVVVGILVILLLLLVLLIIFGVRYRRLAGEMDAMQSSTRADRRNRNDRNGGSGGTSGGRRARRRDEEEDDDYYYDEEEDDDDDVFVRSRTDRYTSLDQTDLSETSTSQPTQGYDFAAEKERIRSEAPTESLQSGTTQYRSSTENVRGTAQRSSQGTSRRNRSDDDDDLEFL